MTQRLFCCRNEREARRAVLASYFGILVTLLVLVIGVGLWYYYEQFPLAGEALEAYEDRGDRIFPIFILTVIPTGLTGLIVAGIFAAAISSLDSILAALSQTTLSAFYLPWRERKLAREGKSPPRAGDPVGDPLPSRPAAATAEDRRMVFVSRLFVVSWGAVLCTLALGMDRAADHFDHLLGLALGMAGFVSGGLMAGFFLSLASKRLAIDGTGFLFAAPLGVLAVLAITPFNEYPWAAQTCLAGSAAILIAWFAVHRRNLRDSVRIRQTAVLLAGAAAVVWLAHSAYVEVPDPETGESVRQTLAWPWYAPVGSTFTFVLGYLLAGRRDA